MKYVTAKGQKMSVFSLGTVQLGMNYGLEADTQKPSEEAAFSLLDTAMAHGVDNLDTANNYGDSEAIIGRWMAQRRAEGKELPWVVTKIGPFKHGSYDILRDDMLAQTEGCLKNLGGDSLDCLMLHNFDDYEQDPDAVRKVMEEIKAQKVCKYTAISAYSRHDYGVIADSDFDATQIPLNVFDWGQIESGGMEKLEKSGIMVFIRSVYLQGLVFHTPETVDPRMSFCIPYLEKYIQLCNDFELAPDLLALSFVLSVPGVTTAVMGCRNEKQVLSNCDVFDKTVQLTADQLERIHEAFRDMDHRVINPGLWFNHT